MKSITTMRLKNWVTALASVALFAALGGVAQAQWLSISPNPVMLANTAAVSQVEVCLTRSDTSGPLTVNLTPVPAGIFAIASGSTLDFSDGMGTTCIVIEAVANGEATLYASSGTNVATAKVYVFSTNLTFAFVPSAITVVLPNTVPVELVRSGDMTNEMTVYLDTTPSPTYTVSTNFFTFTNIASKFERKAFDLTGMTVSETSLFATNAGGVLATATVSVVTNPVYRLQILSPLNLGMIKGQTQTIPIKFRRWVEGVTVLPISMFTMSSSPASLVSLLPSADVLFPAFGGAEQILTTNITIRADNAGSGSISITSVMDHAGAVLPVTVISNAVGTFFFIPDPVTINLASNSTVQAQLGHMGTNSEPLSVGLVSSDPTIFSVAPATVIFPSNSIASNVQFATVTFTGFNPGVGKVDIMAGGGTNLGVSVFVFSNTPNYMLTVEPSPVTINLANNPVQYVRIRRTGPMAGTLNSTLTATLTSSNLAVFTAPADVSFPATADQTQLSGPIALTGHAPGGTSVLHVAAAGYAPANASVRVLTSTKPFIYVDPSPINVSFAQRIALVNLVRQSAAPGDLNSNLTVNMFSLDPELFTPWMDTVTFPATMETAQTIQFYILVYTNGSGTLAMFPDSAQYDTLMTPVNVFADFGLYLPSTIYVLEGGVTNVALGRASPTLPLVKVQLTSTPAGQTDFKLRGDGAVWANSDVLTVPAGALSSTLQVKGITSTTAKSNMLYATLAGYSPAMSRVVVVGECDSDKDGLPDRWEIQFLGTLIFGAGDDPDLDSLLNLQEYQAGTDPSKFDTGSTGQSDYSKDSDGDGIRNGDEQNVYDTHPGRRDTDDDSLNDEDELVSQYDPLVSLNPYVARALRFADGGTVTVADEVACAVTSRLDMASFTLECWAKPSSLASGRRAIVSRKAGASASYELGVTAGGKPYVRFQANSGTEVEAVGGAALALNTWSHLAGRYVSNSLTLLVNGLPAQGNNTGLRPATGVGPLILGGAAGQGFLGDVRDVRIWKVGRTDQEIANVRNLSLFYNENVINPGVLDVPGDGGHLRENSPTGNDNLLYWTIETWVKTAAGNGGTLISKWNTPTPSEGDYNYFIRMDSQGRVQAGFGGQYVEYTYKMTNGQQVLDSIEVIVDLSARNHVQGALKVNDGKWHHVAYVRDAVNAILYIDGQIDSIQDSYLYPVPGANKVVMGGVPRSLNGPLIFGADLNGQMDESRVWKAGMPASEIRENMSHNLQGDDIRLVSYFNYDNYGGGVTVLDRASLFDNPPNPDQDVGLLAPNSRVVSGRLTPPSYLPAFTLYPFRVLGGVALAAFFSCDDSGDSVEDSIHELNWDYAGIRSGGVTFVPYSGTDPDQDSDNDGLPDAWETQHGLNPRDATGINGGWGDPDGDGLNNRGEYLAHTDPRNFDTNGDGLSDYDSPSDIAGKSWGDKYTDSDGMPDDWESQYPGTLSPLLYDAEEDPDGDGWDNYSEYMAIVTDTNGAVVRGTLPNNNSSHPQPPVNFTFTYNNTNSIGTLRIFAYHSSAMDGVADATHSSATVSNRFNSPMSVRVNQFESGYLRQGDNWFFAFYDRNDDGVLDAGEPAGLGKDQPIRVEHSGDHAVTIDLVDAVPGLARFGWQASAMPMTYTVAVVNVSQPGAPRILERQINNRNFFHENDYYISGIYGLPYAGYAWYAYDGDGMVLTTGWFNVTYPSTLVTPTPNSPVGGEPVVYARNKFKWSMGPTSGRYKLDIRRGSMSGETIYTAWHNAPMRLPNGTYEAYMPYYAGDIIYGLTRGFTNGVYYYSLQAQDGRNTSGVGSGSFTMNLQEATLGAATIAGNIYYFGGKRGYPIVIQAFSTRGFGVVPEAQIAITNNVLGSMSATPAPFKLMGLHNGTYYVRAFIDMNYNKNLDYWESWGFVKNPTLYAGDYEPKPLTVPGNIVGQYIVLRDRNLYYGLDGSILWSTATLVGGNWKWLSWFGYFADMGTGWIYHAQHGWMYAFGTDLGNIWFWTPDKGWLWTGQTEYPFIYRHPNSSWYWYLLGSASPRWLFDINTGSWETW